MYKSQKNGHFCAPHCSSVCFLLPFLNLNAPSYLKFWLCFFRGWIVYCWWTRQNAYSPSFFPSSPLPPAYSPLLLHSIFENKTKFNFICLKCSLAVTCILHMMHCYFSFWRLAITSLRLFRSSVNCWSVRWHLYRLLCPSVVRSVVTIISLSASSEHFFFTPSPLIFLDEGCSINLFTSPLCSAKCIQQFSSLM